jgi:hypothetical protein
MSELPNDLSFVGSHIHQHQTKMGNRYGFRRGKTRSTGEYHPSTCVDGQHPNEGNQQLGTRPK